MRLVRGAEVRRHARSLCTALLLSLLLYSQACVVQRRAVRPGRGLSAGCVCAHGERREIRFRLHPASQIVATGSISWVLIRTAIRVFENDIMTAERARLFARGGCLLPPARRRRMRRKVHDGGSIAQRQIRG
eukprot:794135-Rhodomonas_salina.1